MSIASSSPNNCVPLTFPLLQVLEPLGRNTEPAVAIAAHAVQDKDAEAICWCYLVLSCFGEIIFDSNANIKYRQHGNNTIGATVNRFDELKRKLHRFIYSEKGLPWLQASIFLNTFENGIPLSQRLILNKFIAAKSSLWGRVQLVLSKEIWRQKWFDNLILRFIIFINRI